MAAIHETAYPRLKSTFTQEELNEYYTPSREELSFCKSSTRKEPSQIVFLALLKIFQRLGYFVMITEIPPSIINHITNYLGVLFIPKKFLENYDESGSRARHMKWIRDFSQTKLFDEKSRHSITEIAYQTAKTKEYLADIINVLLEHLIKEHYELPVFDALHRISQTARTIVNEECYALIYQSLDKATKVNIEHLLNDETESSESFWSQLKKEPKKASPKNINNFILHFEWLQGFYFHSEVIEQIPKVKLEQFYFQAYAANSNDIKRFPKSKRYAFVSILVFFQMSKMLDDTALILIKVIKRLHNQAKDTLNDYHFKQREKLNLLIETLEAVTQAYQSEGSKEERFGAMEEVLEGNHTAIIDQCNQHLAYANNNYYLCLLPLYKNKRGMIFKCLSLLNLESASQNNVLIEAINFIKTGKKSRKEWVEITTKKEKNSLSKPYLNIKWIPEKWRKLITGRVSREAQIVSIHQRYLELCVFSELIKQLESGDIYVNGGNHFDDYRKHFISWDAYFKEIPNYEALSGISTDASIFVAELKGWLTNLAIKTDNRFPQNEFISIEKGEISIKKPILKEQNSGYKAIDWALKDKMGTLNILEMLVATEKWLHLSEQFHPLSGLESKIKNYDERFVSTLFCYGCNLGATQTARSINGINRKQISWLNAQHITEKTLDKAIVKVINAYNKFALPKFWGSGKSVSADGTKWNVYEQNLLSEYHIRYGGYGGIGYYHVSDNYIALFSRFIPCGVYEAIYILDGLAKNETDIQPNTIHGDTQSQNMAVFGLSYLLGIDLMPRIRNIKKLSLFRPDKNSKFENIEELFDEAIDWGFIKTHLPDMLRVALSVKSGHLTPSTILRRLTTKSRKNKLYFAFRELGRAVRTGFLLKYIDEQDLRRTIQAATNKSEEFNNLVQWVAFGNNGVIAQNHRYEQRKMIKYNHLVANLLILYNVNEMTDAIFELQKEGFQIDDDLLASLAPYRTEHINRYGSYTLNMDKDVPPLNHNIDFFLKKI